MKNNDSFENSSIKSNESYNYIFKVIVVGDPSIGKTSMINRYVTKTFSDKYILTIGVDFMMKTINYEDKTIKLQIWDTAGMERYRQITTSYYRGAQAALVVFDLTNKNSFTNVSRWINEFYQHCNPIYQKKVILIGNKSDLKEERQVTQEDINEFLKINNFPYFECSAKMGDNIENIFNEIAINLYKSYKNSVDEEVKNNIRLRKSTLGNVERYNSIRLEKEKKCAC